MTSRRYKTTRTWSGGSGWLRNCFKNGQRAGFTGVSVAGTLFLKQFLTGASASENVTVASPGQTAAPTRFPSGSARYSTAPTDSSPNRQGADRRTVSRHHPRVVSSPRWQRSSWKVVSTHHLRQYPRMTKGAEAAGSVATKSLSHK